MLLSGGIGFSPMVQLPNRVDSSLLSLFTTGINNSGITMLSGPSVLLGIKKLTYGFLCCSLALVFGISRLEFLH